MSVCGIFQDVHERFTCECVCRKHQTDGREDERLKMMMYRLLMLLLVTNDISAFVQLTGAGGTVPANVYIAWMAAYRSLRSPFVDVRLSYNARSSGFGKRQIAAGSVNYAGTESLLSDTDYDKNPDLQMFPVFAGLALP